MPNLGLVGGLCVRDGPRAHRGRDGWRTLPQCLTQQVMLSSESTSGRSRKMAEKVKHTETTAFYLEGNAELAGDAGGTPGGLCGREERWVHNRNAGVQLGGRCAVNETPPKKYRRYRVSGVISPCRIRGITSEGE